jgi:flagellar biosynthesis chaperone FliJ
MAFYFALEAVLRVRRSQERVERLKLEAIVSEQDQVRARLHELTARSLELHRQFQARLTDATAGSEVQFENERETNTNLFLGGLRKRLVELDQRRLAQVQIFREVRRNRELIENLRVGQFNAYRMEQGRRSQQELDDLFLMRQAHKSEE